MPFCCDTIGNVTPIHISWRGSRGKFEDVEGHWICSLVPSDAVGIGIGAVWGGRSGIVGCEGGCAVGRQCMSAEGNVGARRWDRRSAEGP